MNGYRNFLGSYYFLVYVIMLHQLWHLVSNGRLILNAQFGKAAKVADICILKLLWVHPVLWS